MDEVTAIVERLWPGGQAAVERLGVVVAPASRAGNRKNTTSTGGFLLIP